jgi:ppGpp synthetase/RelA/SpoT-type nucleotidyltranferase
VLCVVLPISKSRLKNLTERLRQGRETPEDLHDLADVLIYYRRVLDGAHVDIERLCAQFPNARPMAPRVKTLKTMLEKLNRQPGLHSLVQVRDLAGLRVVVHGSRAVQDDLVEKIEDMFQDASRPPKMIDRRLEPRAGYRAVHLEVRRGGVLLEVQVRTTLQHQWAEAFEGAADRFGRGLRYGEDVDYGGQPELGMAVVKRLNAAADLIDNLERGVIADLFGPDLAALTLTAVQEALEGIAKQLRGLP